jgi:hypothetical protein
MGSRDSEIQSNAEDVDLETASNDQTIAEMLISTDSQPS